MHYIKKLFIKVCLLTLFLPIAFAVASPSKHETVEFIENKIHDNQSLFRFNFRFSKDQCTLSFNRKTVNPIYWHVDFTKINVHREEFFDPYTNNQILYSGFRCISGNCIKMSNIVMNDGSGVKTDYTNSVEPFDSRETGMLLTQKITKAFEHLRSLCSGKKELF